MGDPFSFSRYYLLSSVETDIQFFIQFHLDKQLAEAHRYMSRKGVILKGDIL
jgi:4-alpha-glucanotransferase